MAFDGITISNIVKELNDKLVGGRINKISQPEKDELILTVKNGEIYKLLISANPSLPLIYLTEMTKENPLTAPNFCMLLRKHFQSAKILQITQPGFERVIDFTIEHYNEMGDLKIKHLIAEIMGKHSNIILCDDEGKILDSIKRVPSSVSSVREVLPGRDYFIPKTGEKMNPLELSEEAFISSLSTSLSVVSKAIYENLTGISPLMANEFCFRASIDSDRPSKDLSEAEKLHLAHTIKLFFEDVAAGIFEPKIYYKEKGAESSPADYAVCTLKSFENFGIPSSEAFDSISSLLETFYAKKNQDSRIRQKSTDLRRIISNLIERESKKFDLQSKQIEDTYDRETYQLYGELLTVYGYSIEEGATEFECENYNDNGNLIKIPLDPTISPMKNATKYFEKYSKQKRTFDNLILLLYETGDSLAHLKTIELSLSLAENEADLNQIKDELFESGYIKKSSDKKTGAKPSKKGYVKQSTKKNSLKPTHFVTPDGYDLYVGKNNLQNEELTFNIAKSRDWWFHTKKVPGSHVILVNNDPDKEIPDHVFELAAGLAAYYSSGKDNDKVEVDYIQKKHVKKPSGGVPGFVIYHENFSMVVKPSIFELKEID